MPFVQRAVTPVRLSRAKLHDERGAPTIRDRELEAVTNCTLSNALRQMASVAALADEVFRELRGQLTDVATRSAGLKLRVQALGQLVDDADPKAVTVRKFQHRLIIYNYCLDISYRMYEGFLYSVTFGSWFYPTSRGKGKVRF